MKEHIGRSPYGERGLKLQSKDVDVTWSGNVALLTESVD